MAVSRPAEREFPRRPGFQRGYLRVSWPGAVSLRAKLLLGTLLMLVPVLVLLLLAFNASYDRRQDIVLESLLQTSRGAAALVDATFDEAITLGQAIAGEPAIQSLDPDILGPRLRRLGTGYDHYETFFVFDATGELIGESEQVFPAPLNISDRPYFRNVMQTGRSTSFNLVVGRRDGNVSTGVAVPIYGESDDPIGVLVIGFDLDRLQERIASMGVAGTQSISLFDSSGRLALVAADRPLAMERSWEQRDFAAQPEIQAALAGETVRGTNFTSDLDERPLAMTMVRSRQHGWVAVAAWPSSDAFGPANEARQRELAQFFGIAAVSLVGTVLVASSLTRPVRRLADGVLAFGRGDLGRRLDIRTDDEIGQLGRAFNTMAAQIQSTLHELDSARAEAEAGQRAAETARAEAELAGRRATFLAEAGAALSESLDYGATLQRVADLAVPTIADWCVVDVVERDGRLSRVAAAHADESRASSIAELQQRYAPRPDWPEHPVWSVLRDARPIILANLDQSKLWQIARDADHVELLRALGTFCLMVVPLRTRGGTLGTMSFATGDSGRQYGPDDLALAESLASRAAVAVDNARLYTETERAVRVRDEFLASASHELRTPISHVKGFVSSLRQSDVEWEEDVRQDFLAEIERETDRLAKLIEDLLDMTRLESGGLDQIDRALVRPSDIVAGGLDRVRGLVRRHNVLVDVSADLPAVLGDAAQLERVVANLIENAVKFSPPGLTIRISGAQVDSNVEVRVEDEGPGIPHDQLEQIFEKFYRGRNGAMSIPGTGLGLSICRRIVEAHGGRIYAKPAEQGAHIVVELPISARVPQVEDD